jgi:DNA-binding HxlR family transcriptional regulator
VSGYSQFCPVAKTSEVLCERWAPLIIRELLCGSRRFTEIQRGVPGISPALLSKRLRQLVAAGVISRTSSRGGADYVPTEAGWELYPIIEAMGVWGQRWARSTYSPAELDPSFLMWDIRRMVQPGLRDTRTVIEFRLSGAPRGKANYWLVDADSIDLCLIDPGYPVDLWVNAQLPALTKVWMGDATMDDCLDAGSIEVHGPRALARRFPTWLGQHPIMAKVGPATPAALA